MAIFVLTILFGFLGIYRFHKKQYVLGILYLFTLGLFGIGWIMDVFMAYKEVDFSEIKLSQSEEKEIPEEVLKDIEEYDNKVRTLENLIESAKSNNTFTLKMSTNKFLCRRSKRMRLPLFIQSNIREKFVKVHNSYDSIVFNTYFFSNDENKTFKLIMFDERFNVIETPDFPFSKLIGCDCKKKENAHTSSSSVGSANLLGHSRGGVGFGSGRTSSSTEIVFEKGTVILKIDDKKYPIISLEIYEEEQYDKFKSYLDIMEFNK
ncbi:MAG: hypothetical protein J1F32_03975 [Erysipelotrichales bacterium]|nr:hypothetical protein [Erysipelotrichales bacterium]